MAVRFPFPFFPLWEGVVEEGGGLDRRNSLALDRSRVRAGEYVLMFSPAGEGLRLWRCRGFPMAVASSRMRWPCWWPARRTLTLSSSWRRKQPGSTPTLAQRRWLRLSVMESRKRVKRGGGSMAAGGRRRVASRCGCGASRVMERFLVAANPKIRCGKYLVALEPAAGASFPSAPSAARSWRGL